MNAFEPSTFTTTANNLVPIVVALVAGLLGGGAAVVKWLNRPVDAANVREKDVDTLSKIIDEVRTSEAVKDKRIDKLEERINKLEERERHMLTRAAVHEAWDQLAFQALLARNPQHPPPPPLTGPEDRL
jgi:hypothetical protein